MLIHALTRDYIFAAKRNRLHIRVQYVGKQSDTISIFYWNRFHSESVYTQEMQAVGRDSEKIYYETELSFAEAAQYIQYFFVVETDSGLEFWSRYGCEQTKPKYFYEYLATAELDILQPPIWAQGKTWYQIFPERFYDGDPGNNPVSAEPWTSAPTRENHFGGDLAGIRQKLPYLEALGIDILYMTPVFASPSNHKYDTTDYFSIDAAFGTTQDLIDLVSECHQRGIKVILDGVFNHIGYSSPQFQDVLKNGEKSQYADWFYIREFPIQTEPLNYECVGYYKWMPKLRYATRAVRDYILRVGRYWIETADIDGWRLDVADEVDFTFWQEFRHAIKQVKPEAFLLGETWKDGRDMLRGDGMDSVMNYLFRDAALDFFARREIDAETFEKRMSRMLFGYTAPVRPVLYNALGSHDTARLLTECDGDAARMRLAAAFQMTFPGSPAVYYGDEIGMDGENDPDCRKPMAWAHPNEAMLAEYKKLIALRKNSPSLREGDFRFVYAADGVTAFARTFGSETTYVVFNNTDTRKSLCVPILEAGGDILHVRADLPEAPLPGTLRELSGLTGNGLWTFDRVWECEMAPMSYGAVTVRIQEKASGAEQPRLEKGCLI